MTAPGVFQRRVFLFRAVDIITRNLKHFRPFEVPVKSPDELAF